MLHLLALSLLPLILSSPTPITRRASPADLTDLRNQVANTLDAAIQRGGAYDGSSGIATTLNDYIPVSASLDSTIGVNNLVALDVLADKACIAGRNEGSVCNEVLAYAYAWYVAQQDGFTYRQVAHALGVSRVLTTFPYIESFFPISSHCTSFVPVTFHNRIRKVLMNALFFPMQPDNMQTINTDLNILCLDPDVFGEPGLCQYVTEDTDVLVNTIIGEGSVSFRVYLN